MKLDRLRAAKGSPQLFQQLDHRPGRVTSRDARQPKRCLGQHVAYRDVRVFQLQEITI